MKNKHFRYFIISMISTFFVLALFTGFTVVEKNVQNTISSNPVPFFSYTAENFMIKSLKFHFMGKNIVFNFWQKMI